MIPRVTIQTADFDLSTEVAKLRADDKRVGAVCAFVGTVRDLNDGDAVSELELEHYKLQPLDQIVMVAVTAAHRGESFKGCEFIMDYLKTQAPFWKKEQTPHGDVAARWVDARASDDASLNKWQEPTTP